MNIPPPNQIAFWEIAVVELRLARDIPSATGGNISRQLRAYVRLRLLDGSVGYGEAAPHPVRPPSLETVIAEMHACQAPLRFDLIPGPLQCALVDAFARSQSIPVWKLLALPEPRTVQIVETFGGELPGILNDIAQSPCEVAKLKVRPGQRWHEIARAIIASGRKVILDPNGSWSIDESAEAIAALAPLAPSIVWLEQPCRPDRWTSRLSAPFPIFSDEAAESLPEQAIMAYDGLVLKPSMLGLGKCLALARRACQEKRFLVAGCLLQSSITTALSLQLSGLYSTHLVDLDTVLLLENDPFTGIQRFDYDHLALNPAPGLGVLPEMELPWRAGGILRWTPELLQQLRTLEIDEGAK